MIVVANPTIDGKELVSSLLERALFEDYLLSQDPSDLVGFCNHHLKCPLAWYLESKVYGHRFSVGASTYMFADYETCGKTDSWEVETPDWAKAFIDLIDDIGDSTTLVSARDALMVLSNVK